MDALHLSQASVAMKMNWASGRKTTRTEDTAYCLLGTFDVNMPLLYGEREKAFFRLQVEIIKNSDDESIFAWTSKGDKRPSGMLACWPSAFASSNNVRKINLPPEYRLPWTWTNKGLELRLLDQEITGKRNYDPMPYDPMPPGWHRQLVPLGCQIDKDKTYQNHQGGNKGIELRSESTIIAIQLQKFGKAWQRTDCDEFHRLQSFGSIARSTKTPVVYRHNYIPQHLPRE